MANDIDIIVGVKDLATNVLERISSRVNAIGDNSKLAFAGAAERLNDQLAKASSSAIGSGNSDKLAKAIEAAANGLSTKLDVALAKTNSAIDSVTGRIQAAISSVTGFVSKAAAIATTAAAFVKVGSAIASVPPTIARVVIGMNGVETSANKARVGVLSSLAPFGKYIIAAGATVSLTKATLQATSATSSLFEKVTAVGRGALAAFVLRNALKKTEEGASTLGAKLAKVAGFALAFDVAARATLRFGLSLVGLGKKADESTAALLKTANAGNTFTSATAKISAAPFNAVRSGASAAAVATANLSGSFDDLPKGAQSVNTVVSSFGNFAAQIGGIPGLLLAIPAGLAGFALAAVTAAGQTERQLTQLTNKMQLIEAAKLNVSIEEIDTAPLRKIAEDTEKIAKQIQTATNVQSSKLLTVATNSLPKGLGTEQIGEALKAAVGLSEVYGTSVEDGMYRARQAIEGNFQSFEKLIPSIATMTSDSDKLAAVSRLAANGFKIMSSESNTFWGTIEKVKNGLGNTLESLGRFHSLSDVVGTILRDVVTPAVEFLDSKLKGFGFNGSDVLEQATSLGAGVIAAIDTIGSNWDSILDRMTIGSELFWVQLKSHVESFVNNTLPWLGDNFVSVMKHAYEQVKNGFMNFQYDQEYSSIVAVTEKAIADQGSGISLEARQGAVDSMRKQLEELDKKYNVNQTFKPSAFPELTKLNGRNISSEEKEIQSRLDAVDSKLGKSFNENFKKAFDSLDGMLKDQKKAVGDINLAPKVPDAPKVPEAIEKQAKATISTTAALESRFLARGASNDPQREMAQTLKRQEALMQRQLVALEKSKPQADKLEVEVLT